MAAAAIGEGHADAALAMLDPLRDLLGGGVPQLLWRFASLHPEIDFSREWFFDSVGYLDGIEEGGEGPRL